MARVKIDLPERFPFSAEVPLYSIHINWGKHLDNALLLTIVTEARIRYFKFLGYTEEDVEGYGITVSDAAVQYLSEGLPGDTMVVEMAFREPNKYGGDLMWRMRSRANYGEVARGKTGIVFLDYAQRKVVPIPSAFLKKALGDSGLVP